MQNNSSISESDRLYNCQRPLSEYRTLLQRQAGTRTFALVFRSAPLGHILVFFPLQIPFNVPLVAIEFKLTLG